MGDRLWTGNYLSLVGHISLSVSSCVVTVSTSTIRRVNRHIRRGCRRTETELFRSPPLEFGTVWHTTSRLHSHCQFSAVVWRLISSDAVFLDYSVVPAKWHLSLWTH